MGDYACCRIERLANGYEVEVTDPAIVKANRERDGIPYDKRSKDTPPWRDPKVSYAFKDVTEVMAFLEKNLDKALPMDDYSFGFDEAVEKGNTDA